MRIPCAISAILLLCTPSFLPAESINDGKLDNAVAEQTISVFREYIKWIRDNEWKISYTKEMEQDGAVLAKYLATTGSSGPTFPVDKRSTFSYCAGIFGSKVEIFHLVESLKAKEEEVKKNSKVIFDGAKTYQFFFSPAETIKDALGESRPSEHKKTSDGKTWSRVYGEGAPLDVLSFHMGFGGEDDISLEKRCTLFFNKAKSLSVRKSSENLTEIRAELDAKAVVIYKFDQSKGGALTEWSSDNGHGINGLTTIEYRSIPIEGKERFVPKKIQNIVKYVESPSTESVVSTKLCEFHIFEPASDAEIQSYLEGDINKLSWLSISREGEE